MRKIFLILAITTLLSSPTLGADFILDDFEPADPELTEAYELIVKDLMNEVGITGFDERGRERFRVTPYPMELVALQVQADIHERNVTDPEELYYLIEQANLDKPGPNWFAVIIDGEAMWAGGGVSMYYRNDSGRKTEPIEITKVDEFDEDDGSKISIWVMSIKDEGGMIKFMEADEVFLQVDKVESLTESITLDCSHWRTYTLFDLSDD